VSFNKSKLSANFYSNFDQFLEETKEVEQTKPIHVDLKATDSQKSLLETTSENGKGKGGIGQEKEAALKKLEERKALNEQKKKQLATVAKEKAKKGEMARKAKMDCAIRIQKMWKGHL